jgi:hypothetical protein
MILKQKITDFCSEISYKKIFLILFGIWNIDFILTFIATFFLNNFNELNPLASNLFTLGLIGYFIFYLIVLFLILMFSKIIVIFREHSRKKYLENSQEDKSWKLVLVGIVIFSILEFLTIINNLVLLIKLLI